MCSSRSLKSELMEKPQDLAVKWWRHCFYFAFNISSWFRSFVSAFSMTRTVFCLNDGCASLFVDRLFSMVINE